MLAAHGQTSGTIVGTGGTITVAYNSTTETLTLTGSDTLADYRSALDSVTFTTASDNPDDFGSAPTRQITWTLDDGSASNNTAVATSTIAITAVNDPPALTGTADATFTEGGVAATLSGAASVSDPDSPNLTSATVAIIDGDVAGDVLTATGTGNITVAYDSGSETLTLTGSDTLAHYQAVLDTVAFSSTSLNPTDFGSDPTRLVTWTLVDDSGTASDTSFATTNITVNAVNSPPTLAGAADATFVETGPPVTLSPSVAAIDPDGTTLASATVAITGGTFAGDGDVLAARTLGTSIIASYHSDTETLVLTGSDTLAHYTQVLDSVTFGSSSHNPTDFGSSPTRVLSWVADDGSASNNLSTAQPTTVTITPVNDPPTLSNVATTVPFATGQTVTVSPALTLIDPDNLTLASATVRVTGGSFTGDGDVLGFSTTGTSITGSYNSTTETLTLSGIDTPADYQHVLDSVTFTTGANPTNNGADPTRTLTWTVDDGSASNHLATATTTITFQPTLRPVGSGDVNTDGKADLVWENTNDGSAVVWVASSGGLTQVAVPAARIGAEWTPSGLGHDAAGQKEIIWNNAPGGQIAIWQLNGTNLGTAVVTAGKVGSEWHVAAIGDFNGDGSTDVMWENNIGNTAVWSLNGVNLISASLGNGVINPMAHVIATGDYFGTGRDAVLWEDAAGNLQSWSMNGANVVATATVGQIGSEWHVAGEGDFELGGGGSAHGPAGSNAEDDIVWVDTNNDVMIWQMQNGVISRVVTPAGHDGTEWHLDAVADFTGDGKSDLLWLRADGTANIWQINGNQAVTSSLVNGPGGDTLQLSSAAAAQATTSNATTPAAMVASTGDVPAFAVMSSPDIASAAPALAMADITPVPTTLGFTPNGTAGALAPSGDATDANLALMTNYMAASFATPADTQSGRMLGEPQPAGSLPIAPPTLTHHA